MSPKLQRKKPKKVRQTDDQLNGGMMALPCVPATALHLRAVGELQLGWVSNLLFIAILIVGW
jgi:hypothetical protein